MAKEIDLGGSISTRFSVHGFNNTRKRPKSVIKKLVNLKGGKLKKEKKKTSWFQLPRRQRAKGNETNSLK